MKKIVFYAIVFSILCISCANAGNLPRRIDDFVAGTEASAKYMTPDDWELSTERYEAMLEEFVENYDRYTPQQRTEVYEAVERYNGLLVKHGLTDLQIQVNEFMNELNKYLDEFSSAADSRLEGFRNGLE